MAEEGKSAVSLISGLQEKPAFKPSIGVFRELIEKHYGNNIRMNEMTGRPEFYDHEALRWREWSDVRDCQMRAFFQTTYGLYKPEMLYDALQMHMESHRVNPLTDILDRLKWDGIPRMERFLTETMHTPDTPYYREVSRLIFAGGIWRAYNPGCKFDDMAVLVGKQGGGKSTLVRWLNIDDGFFREIKTISGKEGIEALRGVWIAEVAELMAMTRVKETEAVKAYVTSQEDSYRAPYKRHVETIPRRCIFIGTTNNPQFLSDRTGNRRFYPVLCDESGYDLRSREKEVREYIKQCWAEALRLYRDGALPPYAKEELLNIIKKEQESATEDDWRIGAIRQYLDDQKKQPGSTVSVIELWHMALGNPEESKPSRKDSIEIGVILNEMEDWERCEKTVRSPRWGVQRVYQRKKNFYPFWG